MVVGRWCKLFNFCPLAKLNKKEGQRKYSNFQGSQLRIIESIRFALHSIFIMIIIIILYNCGAVGIELMVDVDTKGMQLGIVSSECYQYRFS